MPTWPSKPTGSTPGEADPARHLPVPAATSASLDCARPGRLGSVRSPSRGRAGMGETGLVRDGEVDAVAGGVGAPVTGARPLAGGFSHETCLLTLAGGGRVVVRLGGADPAIE